jgi:hypothetical protein
MGNDMSYDINAVRARLYSNLMGEPPRALDREAIRLKAEAYVALRELRRTCPHTETRIVELQNHAHWAREECASCGKFLRWPKRPTWLKTRQSTPNVPALMAAIRAAARPVSIQGTARQAAWAMSIRRELVVRFGRSGATMLLEAVHNPGWFIPNRNARTTSELTWPDLADVG